MTWPITIRLDGPPRGKARGRAVSTPTGARVFTDDKTRRYESQIRFTAQQEMAGASATIQPVAMQVEVRFAIAPSWSKKKQSAARLGQIRPCTTPDSDNLLKSAADSLNGVVFIDDRQIVSATVSKVYADNPGMTIIVWPITLSLVGHQIVDQLPGSA